MNQLGIYVQDEISFGQSPFPCSQERLIWPAFYDGAFIVNNPTNETAFCRILMVPCQMPASMLLAHACQ